MKLWRRRQVKEAEAALRESRRDRLRVDRVAGALIARQAANNFGPMVERALRERRA